MFILDLHFFFFLLMLPFRDMSKVYINSKVLERLESCYLYSASGAGRFFHCYKYIVVLVFLDFFFFISLFKER